MTWSFTAVTNWIKSVVEVVLYYWRLLKPSLNIVSNCIFFGLLKKKNTISGSTYKLKNVNFGSSETVNYECSNQFIPFCHSQR